MTDELLRLRLFVMKNKKATKSKQLIKFYMYMVHLPERGNSGASTADEGRAA
jgi:hypothetical protein